VEGGSKHPDPLTTNAAPLLGGRAPFQGPEDTGARPLFVDPPAPAEVPGRTAPSRRESVYEQTILPSLGDSSRPPGEATAGGRGQPFTWSPLLVGGMVAAGLVVVAALLLVLGVL
jgi:hypothetical protein